MRRVAEASRPADASPASDASDASDDDDASPFPARTTVEAMAYTLHSMIEMQDKEIRTKGKKAVQFHATGKEFLGCGWNWYGWYPDDSGDDISAYKNLHLWAKLTGDTKPTETKSFNIGGS